MRMTNQEAILILNEQRNKFMDEWVDFGGVNEAYNMAIQALEEKDCVRCINCRNNNECSIQYMQRLEFASVYTPEDWYCADFDPSNEAIDDAFGEDG